MRAILKMAALHLICWDRVLLHPLQITAKPWFKGHRHKLPGYCCREGPKLVVAVLYQVKG
jgi:hypothetical protein